MEFPFTEEQFDKELLAIAKISPAKIVAEDINSLDQ